MKGLNAGSYLSSIQIEVKGKKANKEIMVNFLEQEDIESYEYSSGIIKKRHEIVRHNIGNVKKFVDIRIEKGLISSLFTSFNINPSDSGFKGLQRYYAWEKELVPNEELKVTVTTNWFYPILVILLIILVIYFIKRSAINDIDLDKKVSFVKTKGGQFALKITLRVRAKRFIERIHVVDKLPALVKLYEKFGAVPPDDIDLKNKRLEWEIESLNQGEERVFSYIIYSRIGVIGRFELPSATSVYEREGKIREATSNRAFFINDPASRE